MFSIAYPADEHYITPQSNGVPQYENAKQIIASKRRLVNLYAFNKSAAAVFLAVVDSPDQGGTINSITVYPIAAGSFISIATHGGDRFEKGIYLIAFNDAELSSQAANNIMFYKVDWMAYL